MIRVVLLFGAVGLFALFGVACILRDGARREREQYQAFLDGLERMARG